MDGDNVEEEIKNEIPEIDYFFYRVCFRIDDCGDLKKI
jgi:hypothetical protein